LVFGLNADSYLFRVDGVESWVWFDIARPCLDLYLLNVFFSYPCDFWRYGVIFWYFFSRFRHSEVVAMILAPYILWSKRHYRFLNFSRCVIPVHELLKCVIQIHILLKYVILVHGLF
jgi:hypothetical protein